MSLLEVLSVKPISASKGASWRNMLISCARASWLTRRTAHLTLQISLTLAVGHSKLGRRPNGYAAAAPYCIQADWALNLAKRRRLGRAGR